MAKREPLLQDQQVDAPEEEPAEQGEPEQQPIDPADLDTEGPPSQGGEGEPTAEEMTQRYDQTGGWSEADEPEGNFGGTNPGGTTEAPAIGDLPDRFADDSTEGPGLANPQDVLAGGAPPFSGPDPSGFKSQDPGLTDMIEQADAVGSGGIRELADVSDASHYFDDGSQYYFDEEFGTFLQDANGNIYVGQEADNRYYEKFDEGSKVVREEGEMPTEQHPWIELDPEPAVPVQDQVEPVEDTTPAPITDSDGNVVGTVKDGSIQLDSQASPVTGDGGGGNDNDGVSTPVDEGTYTDPTGQTREWFRTAKEQVIQDDPDGHLINPERVSQTHETNPLVEEQSDRSGIETPTDDGTGEMGSGAQNPPGGYTDPAEPDGEVVTDGVYEDMPDVGVSPPGDDTVDLPGLDDTPEYQIVPEAEEAAAARVPAVDDGDDDLLDS